MGTPSHPGHMDRVAATMPSQAHVGAAQEAPDIGQWEGQDVPLVRPSSCNVKGGIPSSRRYLPTYLYVRLDFSVSTRSLRPSNSMIHPGNGPKRPPEAPNADSHKPRTRHIFGYMAQNAIPRAPTRDADSQRIQLQFAEFAANSFAARIRCEFGLKFLVLQIRGKFALRIRRRRQNDHACAVFSPDEKLTLNCAMQ